MELIYRSTRNANETATASEAILKGLANEGGLFVPDSIPALDVSLTDLAQMNYQQVAYEVMKLMFTDFTEEESFALNELGVVRLNPYLSFPLLSAFEISACVTACPGGSSARTLTGFPTPGNIPITIEIESIAAIHFFPHFLFMFSSSLSYINVILVSECCLCIQTSSYIIIISKYFLKRKKNRYIL